MIDTLKDPDAGPQAAGRSPSFDLQQLIRMYDFTGKTVVVTGGTGVLGASLVSALAGCGAQVAILGRNLEAGKQVLESLGSRAAQTALFACNVVDRASIEDAARQVLQRFQQVDGLVNAAGGNAPEATTSADRSFFDLPAEALRQVFELNLLGTVLPCQVFGRLMAQQGRGVILNYSS